MLRYGVLVICTVAFYSYCLSILKTLLILPLLFCLYPQVFSKIKLRHKNSPLIQKIIKNCPSLTKRYRPTFYLFNGFLQGLFGMTKGSIPGQSRYCDAVAYVRDPLTLSDGCEISVNWAKTSASGPPSKILIIIPGLGCNSETPNVRCIVHEAFKHDYTVAVFHGRGVCCKLKSIKIHSLVAWEDVKVAIEHIHSLHPTVPLVGIGVSMGGCIILSYAAKTGDKCLLKALATVSSPLNASLSVRKLRSWLNYFGIFDKFIVTVCKRIAKDMEASLKGFKEEAEKVNIKMQDLEEVKSAEDFDDKFTARTQGLSGANEYYREGSMHNKLGDVKIPVFSIHARDDPIVHIKSAPAKEFERHDNLLLAITTTGGHNGFFKGIIAPKRWFQVPCIEFLNAVLKLSKID